MSVAEHIHKSTIYDFGVDPDHANRRSTPAFDASKERLEADGHARCYVCGTLEALEAHHYGCEWMFETICDFDKLKAYLLAHDIYGYSKLMINLPITTVDDVRNLQYICRSHHTGVDHDDGGGGTSIHHLTEPTFNIQLVCVDGANPVPQKGETFEQAMERVKKIEEMLRAS